ncbi:putative ABC transport system permease protein [Roseivirga pacifica]|uniref:Putative ABC transport system permease protein n=1 Tax=Roseivirga pacifica TaxID=1267423 RepID=A0A1I0RAV5_9BACT|nr:ABC transporter permease [Roseivirga pacifica]RKQ49298.1 putative ABC transport system permease protein [Roseivirga pacifica]SEW37760.1 putative ABC transport system permease protein [Roseivirga pacifica]
MKKVHPPKLARRLLRLLISEPLFDDFDGDLTELFWERAEAKGATAAKLHYYKDVLLSARNIDLKRKLKFHNPLVMYKNYLKIAFRNLLKYKGYSFINITGLALGMSACLLILLFVNNELNFDGFHEKKSKIYRLDEVQRFGTVSEQKVALSMYPMGPNILADYPEVVNFTRYWTAGRTLVEYNNKQVYMDKLVRVDTSFLQMFDFKLIEGSRADAFKDNLDVMISETLAKRIFGSEDPIGKTLKTSGENLVKVSGVFEDVPENSHLQFDALVGTGMWDSEQRQNGWGSNYLNTYLQLAPNADPSALEAKFDDFLVKYMGEETLEYYTLFLQPLTDVHLGSMDITHDYNNYNKFARSSVNIFLVLAFFVLLIASINFMNLSTARAATRSREVGVRKSIGAFKGQITRQFMVESVLLTFIALLIGFGLCALAIKPLNQIIDRELSMQLLFLPQHLLLIVATTVFIGFLSGIYPALVMSGFNPVLALKGAVSTSRKSFFRNALVVFQYAIAIAIIIGTVVATDQLNYMQNLNLGFEKDNVIAIQMYDDTNEKYDLLASEFNNLPNVTNVTATSQRLGNNLHQTSMQYRADTALIQGSSSFVVVDNNFFDFYKMEMVEGRALSDDYAADEAGLSFVINETLAQEIRQGNESVLGTKFHFGGADTLGQVVGVVKDFNYNKLSLKVEPLFMSKQDFGGWSEMNVKIKGESVKEALAEMEMVWTELFPQRPFEYKFLDEHIDEMYRSEQQLTKVISILSVLAIIIASLGLFGLASFTVRQRLKEMGIRKVLGASVQQIVMILSRKFTLLVIVAFAIAAPLTYYFMSDWLSSYAFSIKLGLGVFIIVGVGSWLIALLTVSLQSIRVAKSNPVKTLRVD